MLWSLHRSLCAKPLPDGAFGWSEAVISGSQLRLQLLPVDFQLCFPYACWKDQVYRLLQSIFLPMYEACAHLSDT